MQVGIGSDKKTKRIRSPNMSLYSKCWRLNLNTYGGYRSTFTYKKLQFQAVAASGLTRQTTVNSQYVGDFELQSREFDEFLGGARTQGAIEGGWKNPII